jgi:hypothetical protein
MGGAMTGFHPHSDYARPLGPIKRASIRSARAFIHPALAARISSAMLVRDSYAGWATCAN